jgi:hypothetical protein
MGRVALLFKYISYFISVTILIIVFISLFIIFVQTFLFHELQKNSYKKEARYSAFATHVTLPKFPRDASHAAIKRNWRDLILKKYKSLKQAFPKPDTPEAYQIRIELEQA